MEKKFFLYFFIMQISIGSFTLYAQEKTSFQIAEKWLPEYDIRSDMVILYNMDSTFQSRYDSWKAKGYTIGFMTGIAWGQYQDYFTGKFDGKTHFEDAQVNIKGDTIWHSKNVPYINPSAAYLSYIKNQVKKAIDTGISAIYLEEPEYWAFSGYGNAFKKDWQRFYGSPWVAQDATPEATYLSSKLKYHLFYNALNEAFTYAKEYGKQIGREIKCYVPTHSLLNYATWHIVSPEASLASLPVVDGYIGQVWTGTSRAPIYYNGEMKERVFENAFLEYGTICSMVAPTKRKVWFLTDPIEDGTRSWNDYKRNYEATFTAELLYPSVDNFEVMPWPNRIYLGKFPVEGKKEPQPIAPEYATQMQVMINCLNDMPLSSNKVSGTQGIGVLLSNSIMFQRFPEHQGYEDPQLANFYGIALPLLKRGIPVEIVHFENLGFKETLKNIKVLVMSYSNMKPLSSDRHNYLAQWIRKGGVLFYISRDDDPFQTVSEWWNSKGNKWKAPSEQLFSILGLKVSNKRTTYPCGKGCVYILRQNPKELVMTAHQDADYVNLIKEGYNRNGNKKWTTKNSFYLERGAYTIVSVMTENDDTSAFIINHPLIDLFDPELPILTQKVIYPGQQAFLYDLSHNNKKAPAVLCAASRVEKENFDGHFYSFQTKSPSGTNNVMRIFLASKPKEITVEELGRNLSTPFSSSWDKDSKTLLLKFANSANGMEVKINF